MNKLKAMLADDKENEFVIRGGWQQGRVGISSP
jgi:hypothetical protein